MLIDIHAHLDQYQDNLSAALAALKEHQVIAFSNSLDLESYRRNCEIAELSKLVIPVFGVHPFQASKFAGDFSPLNEALASSPLYGEVGLDSRFADDLTGLADQRAVFEQFLSAAVNQNKYLVIHSRGAETEVLELIERYRARKVIMHWFTGPRAVFDKLVDQGAFFSFGADLFYSDVTRQFAKAVPGDQLLTETDNPLITMSLPGAHTMPGILVDTVKELALQRRTTEQDIINTVERNVMAILQSIPPLAGFSKKIARDFKNRRGSRLR